MQHETGTTNPASPHVPDEIARRMTSDLYHYVEPDDLDVRTVLDMYDWIRAGGAPHEESADVAALARMWAEYEQQHRNDWLFRAFGE
jgi:hypothetical protein